MAETWASASLTARAYARLMTYSIVARDPATGNLGVAVQTCLMGVGAVCPWARAGVGAVATQSIVLPDYGPRMLERLARGEAVASALAELRSKDALADQRQVGVVGADGSASAFTGADTIPWAGDVQAEGLSCQANMMASPGVPEAMRDAFAQADGALHRRLFVALLAGESAGGDFRGSQSAAVIVVSGELDPEPWKGVLVNLRVDDHAAPLDELARLLDMHDAYQLLEFAERVYKDGDVDEARRAIDQATALAPHDQNILFTHAVLRLHESDPAPLRSLIARRPGTRGLLDWCLAHDEFRFDAAALEQLIE
jgi:uncharacterized Ntn-hydrolase superfamily protein